LHIESYQFGSLVVDGEVYTNDVIISPERVNGSWRRVKGHELCSQDLEPIWEASPQVLIIGTGAYELMKVLPEALKLMQEKCAEVHVLDTREACKRFSELAREGGQHIVAALHLTC